MMVNLFNIQHFSTADGPGIRTTIFLGGCNLHCPWCHNPECFVNEKLLEMEEVQAHILHDIDFYNRSNGGVTISGGDPLCSPEVSLALLNFCKLHNINTAFDTSLSAETPQLREIAALCDIFLVDMKTRNKAKFAEACGGDLDVVDKNMQQLQKSGANILFRIPLIPDFNMNEADINAIIAYISHFNYSVTLLPFHRLAAPKYEKMGMKWKYADMPAPTSEAVSAIEKQFETAKISITRI